MRSVNVACLVALVCLVAVADVAGQTSSDEPVTLQINLLSIQINRVPPSPSGDHWDGGVIRSLFLGSLTGMYPDIEICLRRGNMSTCRRVCVNAQLYEPEEATDPTIPPTVCKVEVEGNLPIAAVTAVPGREPTSRVPIDLAVVVNEFDPTLNAEPRRHMGGFSLAPANQPPLLSEPEKCGESSPCKLSIPTKTGTFVATFTTVPGGVIGKPQSGGGGKDKPPHIPGPDQQAEKPEEVSYWDQLKKLINDFLWDEVRDAAGLPGKVIEGLAEQAKKAKTNRAECVLERIEEFKLEPLLEKTCPGRSGEELTTCASGVVAQEHPDAAQLCLSREQTYGFLANMWRSVWY
jgi:hypothetical protein